jgi:hypothetical protein
MRTLFFAVCITLLLTMTSCEKAGYNQYVVQNGTDHSIRIEGYDRFQFVYSNGVQTSTKTRKKDFKSTVEIIAIKPHDAYVVFKGTGFHGEPQGIFSYPDEIDSVNIIFNNQKILVQYCDEESLKSINFCDIERNIMNNEIEYEKTKIGRSSSEIEYNFTYTITEADYNNALPIEAH